jgi:hypothetical protein
MSSNNVGHFITTIIITLQHFVTLHHTSSNYTSLHLSTLHFLSFTLHYSPITVLNTVATCNTTVSIVILHYNIIILWDHRRICCPTLTETSLCGAWLYSHIAYYSQTLGYYCAQNLHLRDLLFPMSRKFHRHALPEGLFLSKLPPFESDTT